MLNKRMISLFIGICTLFSVTTVFSASEQFKGKIYNQGMLKPTDSKTNLKVGMKAPDFTLSSVSGEKISLSQYRGKRT